MSMSMRACNGLFQLLPGVLTWTNVYVLLKVTTDTPSSTTVKAHAGTRCVATDLKGSTHDHLD